MKSKVIESNKKPWHYRLKVHLNVKMWFWKMNVRHYWNWITSKQYRLSYGECDFYCNDCYKHNWVETDAYCKSNPKCTVKKSGVCYIDGRINIMIHLTNNEADVLRMCEEDKGIRIDEKRYHGNTLNSLIRKRCLVCRTYANGDFLEITDIGIDTLNNEIMDGCSIEIMDIR